jgi:hypothetical protein
MKINYAKTAKGAAIAVAAVIILKVIKTIASKVKAVRAGETESETEINGYGQADDEPTDERPSCECVGDCVGARKA